MAGARRALAIVGLLEPADAGSARALEDLLVVDIATAQELLGADGRLTRIDLIVEDAGAAGAHRRGAARPAPTSWARAPRPAPPRA